MGKQPDLRISELDQKENHNSELRHIDRSTHNQEHYYKMKKAAAIRKEDQLKLHHPISAQNVQSQKIIFRKGGGSVVSSISNTPKRNKKTPNRDQGSNRNLPNTYQPTGGHDSQLGKKPAQDKDDSLTHSRIDSDLKKKQVVENMYKRIDYSTKIQQFEQSSHQRKQKYQDRTNSLA